MSLIALLPFLISFTTAALLQTRTEAVSSFQQQHVLSHDEEFQVYSNHEISPHHSVRIKRQSADICNTSVPQWTGWLDIEAHHIFFWFFAPENNDLDEPNFTLWEVGGPGGSAMMGMLFDLGPCWINDHGNGTVHNPYGWNQNSALLFVDQPAGTGFSYVDEGTPVPRDSFEAAADMHVFLQIFLTEVFPDLHKSRVHIAGSSYAGHYVPILASTIVTENGRHPHRVQIPLESIAVGNGFFSPLDSMFGTWETLCTPNRWLDEPVFNSTRCDFMANNLPRCQSMAKVCYDHYDPVLCHATLEWCYKNVGVEWYDEESYRGRRNRFDMTHDCEVDVFCYEGMLHIERYFNLPHVQKALGISKPFNYSIVSQPVIDAFAGSGDLSRHTDSQILYLLHNEIDVLVFQGNRDVACNTAGNLRWANNLAWPGQALFNSKWPQVWNVYPEDPDLRAYVVGWYKEVYWNMSAAAASRPNCDSRFGWQPCAEAQVPRSKKNERKTRFTFATLNYAGHMVQHDDPVASLALFNMWLAGKDFY